MQSILPNLPFIIQISEGTGFVDADGDPYTPDPLPRVIVRQFAADGSYSELVSLVDDEIAEEADLDGGPLTGGFRYEGTAEQAAENTTLKLGFVTTDAALVALGKFFSERWVTVAVVGAAEVDTAAIAAAVWNKPRSELTVAGSIGKWLVDMLSIFTAAGTKFISYFDLKTNSIGPITRGDSYGGAAGGTILVPNRFSDCDLTLATEIRISFLDKGRDNKPVFIVTKSGSPSGVTVISSSMCQPILTAAQTKSLRSGQYTHEATAFFAGSPTPQRTFSRGPVIVDDRDVIP